MSVVQTCLLPASVSRAKNNLVFTASLVHSEWSSGLFCCKCIYTITPPFIRQHSPNKGNILSTRKSCQSRAWNSFLWRLISFSLLIIFDNISSRCFISSMALCSSKSPSSVTWLWPLKVTNIQCRLKVVQPDLVSCSNLLTRCWHSMRVFYVFMQFIDFRMWCGCKSIREKGERITARLLTHLPLSQSLAEEALSISSELLWIWKKLLNRSNQKLTVSTA